MELTVVGLPPPEQGNLIFFPLSFTNWFDSIILFLLSLA